LPVGAPLVTAPFSVTWDSSTSNPRLPHTISARATDTFGRSSASGLVNVQVDNGPTIFAIAVSQGLTVRSARVNWTTDVLADGQADSGPTVGYGSSTPSDPRAGCSHQAQLPALAPRRTSQFRG